MNYLIDGHNLIGKIEDIKLTDPDDEAKLVLRLINWAAVGKNRRVIVVFDKGVPGQNWSRFTSERVRPVFVPEHSTADDWLIAFMKNQVRKNVREYTLVSSDNRIRKQADNRRIESILSEDFAAMIAKERKEMSAMAEEPQTADPLSRPLLREHEVDAWLQFFGGEPEKREIKPYKPKPKAPVPVAPPSDKRPKTSSDPDDFLLSPKEIGDWLDLFGGEPEVVTVREVSTRSKRGAGDAGRVTQRFERDPNTPDVDPDSPMTQDDMDLWHSLFGGG